MKKVLVMAALLCAGSAQAQTTTSCQWLMGRYVCNTTAPPVQPRMPVYTPPDYGSLTPPSNASNSVMDGFQRGMENARRERELDMYQQALDDARERDIERDRMAATPRPAVVPQQEFIASLDTRKAIGALLKEGKCKEGTILALDAGDIELAKKVADYCALVPVVTP